MPRDSNHQRLRIGQLSRAAGVSPDTLRHYERLGLLAIERRTTGGYREYSPAAVRRVSTIRAALAIGFTLKELGLLFESALLAGRRVCVRASLLRASWTNWATASPTRNPLIPLLKDPRQRAPRRPPRRRTRRARASSLRALDAPEFDVRTIPLFALRRIDHGAGPAAEALWSRLRT